MSNLSKALQKFYTKKGNKILFKNNQSLNQLALTMWEQLDFAKIDESVLSRVLRGDRLFTQEQLQVFCRILDIHNTEKDILLQKLNEDYLIKKGVNLSTLFGSLDTTIDLIDDAVKEAFICFYNGQTEHANRICKVVETYIGIIKNHPISETKKMKILELSALSLYLKGRYLTSISPSDEIIKRSFIIANQILHIADKLKMKKLFSFGNTLLCDIYYVAGGYSKSKSKRSLYEKAIKFGRLALTNLENNNPETPITLRDIIASSIIIEDKQSFLNIRKDIEKVLFVQPIENAFSNIHLSGSLDKGFAFFRIANSFSYKEKTMKFFGKNLHGSGSWEISDIKGELEILLFHNTRDLSHIASLVNHGLSVVEQGNWVRHKEYLYNLKMKL